MSVTLTSPSHVLVTDVCTSCRRAVDLECDGLPGFWGYATYNTYLCPYCGKQNTARTSGPVVSARAREDDAKAAAKG